MSDFHCDGGLKPSGAAMIDRDKVDARVNFFYCS